MANNKIARINDDIQRVVSNILRNIKDPRINQGLISVTRTETTSDLGFCKIYVSVLGEVNEKEFMKGVKSASGFIRRELGNTLKLRHTPTLIFELDHSIEHGNHINNIIASWGDKNDDEQ